MANAEDASATSLKDAAPPHSDPWAAASEHDALPRKFGRLTLLKPIARGGMGEVFLATSGGIEGAERPCVVKIIRREHAEDKSFLARFFDEARIQAQLDHPGVAKILEAAIDPSGKPFVVVEYIEGRNLAEIRNRGSQLNVSIAWPEAVAIGVSLAEALAHVHERTDLNGRPLDIVHRDLSPQNVMLGCAGDAKLIDFGTARGENRRCHTVSGVVLAKPGYVAPEVANDTPGGVPADLYALGVMLWELLAGRRFLTGDAQAHVRAVAAGRRNPAPIARLVKAPDELDTIVARMTAPRIEDRYPNARQVMTDLLRLLKKAQSLANGERGVRTRIAHLMERLYPAEPARSRAELARLIAASRSAEPEQRHIAPSPSPPPAAGDEGLFPGTRYRIVRELGRGSMGVVYEAEHVDLCRKVALKVLPNERCDSVKLEARFRTEARAIARLRHDNLVTLHDFGVSSDGSPYYAMELLEGESLEQCLAREGTMAIRDALRIGIESCRALEAAHAAGLVHRDIKPGNLFVTKDMRLKLLDFGVAQAGEDLERTDGEESLRLLGTVEYMAPEQATGEAIDERADLYALGVVLYQLVTGHLPHEAASSIGVIDEKLRSTPVAPSARAPHRRIPSNVNRLILRAMQKNREDRFKSAADMRRALEAAHGAPGRARGRRRAAVALVVAVGLVSASAASLADPRIRAHASALLAPLLKHPSAQRALAHVDGAATPPIDPPVAELFELAPAPRTPKAIAKPQSAPTNSVTPAPQAVASDALTDELAAIAKIQSDGKEISRLNAFRKLVRKYPEDPRVLEGWSKAAIETKGWGEALRAAIKWASVDHTAAAQLHLAKVQRAVGQKYGAVATLERLLGQDADNAEARELLQRYSPGPIALQE